MKKYPFFLYLLPLHFYLWALQPTIDYVQPEKLLLPGTLALGVSLIVHWLIHEFSHAKPAAYIPVFFWYAACLFFGVIKDALPVGTIVSSYKQRKSVV